ncbi:hypothetical protein [Sporosarcina sp. OR05]|uniref:hypothetical protein n=1 Tax=Sporosarcina sp. OR05 TaxID=2969819 RepID=UPI00352A6B8C
MNKLLRRHERLVNILERGAPRKWMSGDKPVMSGDKGVPSGDKLLVSGDKLLVSGDNIWTSGDNEFRSGLDVHFVGSRPTK